jgi:NADH dehydrogenase (ubiquinone) Fe-S protein 1
MVRDSTGKLVSVEWEDALIPVARAIQSAKGEEIAAIVGGFADAEVETEFFYYYKCLISLTT